jgi:hypothetical protein
MMQMDMGVDAAGYDNVAGCINHACRGLCRKRAEGRNRRDGFAGDGNVALHDAVRRHDIAATNDEIEHRLVSRLAERIAQDGKAGRHDALGTSHQIKCRRESAS